MRLALILLTFTVALVSFNKADNFKAPWKFIGDKTVGFGVDHDVIHAGNVNDDFRQIRLHVTNGPLKIYDMKVHFDNGETQNIEIRSQIPKGGYSRVIDLTGGLRHISKIEFWYENKGFAKGRARVAVWGRR